MQGECEKEDMEKRENYPVLFNAPESGQQNAKEKQNEDEVKFTSFSINSFQVPGDRLPKVEKIM